MTDIANGLEESLATNDPSLALQISHTLKGLAATYALKDLANQAEATHNQLKSEDKNNDLSEKSKDMIKSTSTLTTKYLNKIDDIFMQIHQAA